MKTLGERIKALRKAREMSQEELAEWLKMERSSLLAIEHGKRALKADELILLSKALNISIDELLHLESPIEVLLEEGRPPKKKEELRISVPRKNIQKFKEVLLYILGKVGAKPHIGETVLYKFSTLLISTITKNTRNNWLERLISKIIMDPHQSNFKRSCKK